jgi:hypothetical protein
MSTDVTIRTGAVLELHDRDYLGTGRLVLKVGPVPADLDRLPAALEWVVLMGREVHPNGLGEPCKACVRVSAIPGALRPDDWRPPPCSPPSPLDRRTPGVPHSLETKEAGRDRPSAVTT